MFSKKVGAHQEPPRLYKKHSQSAVLGSDVSPFQAYEKLASQSIQVNGRKSLVLGARAVPTAKYNSSYGPVLFQKSGFSVVAVETAQDETWPQLLYRAQDRPVVVNPGNGMLGVVTGTVIVTLGDYHDAETLAAKQNLQLLHVDEAINTAFYRVPENYPMLSGVETLRKDPRVTGVQMEVVQGNKVAQ